jgi:hypothetical protein
VTPVGSQLDEVLALVSDAARRLHDRHDIIATEMSRLLAHHIEALAADAALAELMEASVDANVRTAVHVLTNHIPIEHLQPTTAAVEYALRLAQRDIPGNSLVRAYHMGQEYLVECAFAEVEQLDSPDHLKLDVMRHISQVVYQYIDWISLYVLGTYEAERQRWASSRGNVQSSLIHQVLSGGDVAPSTFESETGYRLDQHHVGAVVWTTEPTPVDDGQRRIERFVADLAVACGCLRRPILTAVDRATAWVWLPFGRHRPADVTAAVRAFTAAAGTCGVALGMPASGVTGFTRSHDQAQAARAVAPEGGDGAPVAVSFGDQGVAVVSLLAGDIESTRLWVQELLGPLAVDRPGAEALRETLRVFFATGESYARTAELLSLHRNTVKYRVAKAFGERGEGREADRLDLAVALQVCRFLGPAVLARPQRPPGG